MEKLDEKFLKQARKLLYGSGNKEVADTTDDQVSIQDIQHELSKLSLQDVLYEQESWVADLVPENCIILSPSPESADE